MGLDGSADGWETGAPTGVLNGELRFVNEECPDAHTRMGSPAQVFERIFYCVKACQSVSVVCQTAWEDSLSRPLREVVPVGPGIFFHENVEQVE